MKESEYWQHESKLSMIHQSIEVCRLQTGYSEYKTDHVLHNKALGSFSFSATGSYTQMGITSNRQGYVSVMQTHFYQFNDMCLELFYAQTGEVNIGFTIKKVNEDLQVETLFVIKGGVSEKINFTKLLIEGTSSSGFLQNSSSDNSSSEATSSQINSSSAPSSEPTSNGDSEPINGSNTGDSEPTHNINSAEPLINERNIIIRFNTFNINEESNENIATQYPAIKWRRVHTHLPDGVYQIEIEGIRPDGLEEVSGMVVDDISIWPCERFGKYTVN